MGRHEGGGVGRRKARRGATARRLQIEPLEARLAFDLNQPPINIVPGPQTFTNLEPTVTFDSLRRIATHDADATGLPLRVTLFVNQGAIKLATTSGLTFLSGADNTRYLLFDGLEADINNALLNMKYTANAGAASDLLTIDVHDLGHSGDGGAKVDRDSIPLTRAADPVNQPPQNVVPGPQVYSQSVRTVTFSGANAIATQDLDAGGLPLRVTLFVSGGTLTLSTLAGLTFRGGGNNTSYLLFDGSQSDINAALNGLRYTAFTNTKVDLLTIDTHDLGHSGSGGAKVDRDVVLLTEEGVQINRPPVNTVPVAQVYSPTARTISFGPANRISTSDPDAGSLPVRVTLFVNSGTLTLGSLTGLTHRGGSNGSSYLLFDGSQSAVNAALDTLLYRAPLNVVSDILTIDVHDLGNTGVGGVGVDRDTVTLLEAGTTINQAPVNTVPGPQTYTVNSRSITFGAINRIATNDVDAGGANLRTTLFVNRGAIYLSTTSGLSFLSGGNGSSYLLFDGSLSAINSALVDMRYIPFSETTSDLLTIDVHDLGHTGAGGAKIDRDSVTLTQIAGNGRSAAGARGEPNSLAQSKLSEPEEAPSEADRVDRILAEEEGAAAAMTWWGTPGVEGDSTLRTIALLASRFGGRNRRPAIPLT